MKKVFLPEEQKTVNAACEAFKETYNDIVDGANIENLPLPIHLKKLGIIHARYLVLKGAQKFTAELEKEIEEDANAYGVTIYPKDRNVYRCPKCNYVLYDSDGSFKFCPLCGRKIFAKKL